MSGATLARTTPPLPAFFPPCCALFTPHAQRASQHGDIAAPGPPPACALAHTPAQLLPASDRPRRHASAASGRHPAPVSEPLPPRPTPPHTTSAARLSRHGDTAAARAHHVQQLALSVLDPTAQSLGVRLVVRPSTAAATDGQYPLRPCKVFFPGVSRTSPLPPPLPVSHTDDLPLLGEREAREARRKGGGGVGALTGAGERCQR